MKTAIKILFVLVVILFGWLGYACYCEFDFNPNNSSGLIISALGVMVAALVGWQVFNAIENVKTLRKMEGLEDDLRSKSLLMTTLNSQVLDIIEAHNERNIAKDINYWENKYIHAAKSLKLFLRGNVSSDYEPLSRLLLDMASIIERVNKEATEDEKIVFARSFPQLEEEHENIIDVIHKREDDLRGLCRQIIRLRDRRKKLFDEYASKETSDEKSEREARKSAEAKELKQQSPETKTINEGREPSTPKNSARTKHNRNKNKKGKKK